MNNLSYELRNYVTYLRRYLIEIDISNEEGTATYNEKEVTKEQVLFKTFVRIYNKNRELVMNTYFDTYSSFFVRDDIPIASISSRCNTLDSIIQNISNTLSIRIISFIEDNKWD